MRHGSFTGAAEELGITPAAVGQRVRTLEDYLGKALFKRTASGIEATQDARQAEATLTTGFSSIAEGLQKLRFSRADNRVSVTLPASFAENWLTPSISEFYQRHAEVDLRLDASNRDVDLLTEDFDFAIRYGQPASDPLQEEILFGDFSFAGLFAGIRRTVQAWTRNQDAERCTAHPRSGPDRRSRLGRVRRLGRGIWLRPVTPKPRG